MKQSSQPQAPGTHSQADATAAFISAHRHDDVRALALQAHGLSGVDVPYALDQIAGWQTARRKLPSWAARDGVVYPPHLSMEQCSSEATARYKAGVASALLRRLGLDAHSMADLTGGFGVDFSFLAPLFSQATYVERVEALCHTATHNMAALGLAHARVVCAQAEDYLRAMQPATMIYLDPARRDTHGGRTVAMAQCQPDAQALLPLLLQKAQVVLVKLSPMLDWHKALADMEGHVAEVHIVATGGECKELLLALTPGAHAAAEVTCVNDEQRFAFSADGGCAAPVPLAAPLLPGGRKDDVPARPLFLYEPNASLMKGGCFAALCQAYGVRGIGMNSHLYLSEERVEAWPGRRFEVQAVCTMNRQALKRCLQGVEQASVAVRNFPLTAPQLRAKLRLKDGASHYVFATTDASGTHVILLCKRF